MMGGFSQKIMAAIAQAEHDFAQQQQLGLSRSREKRAASQDELQRQATLAGLYGHTAKGGNVSIDGQDIAIPGLEGAADISAQAAQKTAEARTRGELNVQLEFADKLNERTITQAKAKLDALGLKDDSPEYNSRLAQALGVPEMIEVELNGQKARISVKDAVDLQQKKMDYDRALSVANIGAQSRVKAAEIGAQSRENVAAGRGQNLPAKVKDTISKLDTSLEVMHNIENTAKDEWIGGLMTGGQELKGRLRTMTGKASPEEAQFRTLVTQTLNEEINRISGAAVSSQEFIRLKAGLPNLSMSPVEFRAAVKNTINRLESLKKNTLKQYEPAPQGDGIDFIPD